MYLWKACNRLSSSLSNPLREVVGLSTINNRSFSSETEPLDKLFSKVEVEVRGNDPAVLKSYGVYATTAAEHLGIEVKRNFAPRKAKHDRMTLLKCKHSNKKHRVQYEIRTWYRFMEFAKLTESTADTYLEYIQRNLPEGVFMKVTKTEIQRLPEEVARPVLGV